MCFLCCPSRPSVGTQPRRDSQRRQPTFLLLAFSGTSVTLLLGFFGSALKQGYSADAQGDSSSVMCLHWRVLTSRDVESSFCGGARLWMAPLCCVSKRLTINSLSHGSVKLTRLAKQDTRATALVSTDLQYLTPLLLTTAWLINHRVTGDNAFYECWLTTLRNWGHDRLFMCFMHVTYAPTSVWFTWFLMNQLGRWITKTNSVCF